MSTGFVQIMDVHTDKFDEVERLHEEWMAATEGKRTVRREIVCRDRNDPNHYVIIVEFDSYESAMVNSNLPETNAFGGKMAALMSGPPGFADLDVVRID